MRHVVVDIATGEEVLPGTKIKSFRGETMEFTGFRIPKNDASTGRIIVKRPGFSTEQEYYPSVFDVQIREIKE